MENKDYEQKKRECWEEFCKRYRIEEPSEQNIESFNWVFDCAYAIGKQTETISQEEIEKAADGLSSSDLRLAFKSGAYFVIGKLVRDADADTVIQGWVARDEDGHLFMYYTKPERDEALQVWMGRYADFDLRDSFFPDLTWEDDPIEVEIIVKRKKNG